MDFSLFLGDRMRLNKGLGMEEREAHVAHIELPSDPGPSRTEDRAEHMACACRVPSLSPHTCPVCFRDKGVSLRKHV